MQKILNIIDAHRSIIGTSEANLEHLKNLAREPGKYLNDETLWTFLLALLYIEDRKLKLLFEQLTGAKAKNEIDKVWIEALPYPPRNKEDHTNLDLALGSIRKRGDTINGIELRKEANSQILFCEMKWESDISTKVTHSPTRNQMARIIENLIAFQDSGNGQPDEFYFTLVTPQIFKNENDENIDRSSEKRGYSRLYGYKFEEYQKDPDFLLNDLKRENCKLPKRENGRYPSESDIGANADKLQMNWKSFEEIIEQAPGSQVKGEIMEIFEKGKKDLCKKGGAATN